MFNDPYFINALFHTLLWIGFNLLVPTSLALLLAVLLNDAIGAAIMKTVFFVPLALSLPVVGIVWLWVYQPDVGLLDQLLRGLGLDVLVQSWLGPKYGLVSVMIASAWRQAAFSMVVFLAGLTAIPKELVEASRIDGANPWQSFWNVTMPMLRPATTIAVSSTVISALLATEIVLTMTNGGPFGTTDVLGLRMYTETFWNYEFSYGAAIGVLISLISAVIVLPYLQRMNSLQEMDRG